MEVHVTCSSETAQKRDPKGLYEKAKKGEIKGLTGYDGKFETSENFDLTINTEEVSVEQAVESILKLL